MPVSWGCCSSSAAAVGSKRGVFGWRLLWRVEGDRLDDDHYTMTISTYVSANTHYRLGIQVPAGRMCTARTSPQSCTHNRFHQSCEEVKVASLALGAAREGRTAKCRNLSTSLKNYARHPSDSCKSRELLAHLPEKLKFDGSDTHAAYCSGVFLIMSSLSSPCLRAVVIANAHQWVRA